MSEDVFLREEDQGGGRIWEKGEGFRNFSSFNCDQGGEFGPIICSRTQTNAVWNPPVGRTLKVEAF